MRKEGKREVPMYFATAQYKEEDLSPSKEEMNCHLFLIYPIDKHSLQLPKYRGCLSVIVKDHQHCYIVLLLCINEKNSSYSPLFELIFNRTKNFNTILNLASLWKIYYTEINPQKYYIKTIAGKRYHF